ncbi:hypothetical protein [Pseudomonas aeruginosa]|uniref:hypothetical protein n=1 Tax=Pseudomonas aeruginosa TaxID=287 RepID=UPI0009FAE820|nr:hypothetical protein [Pseudomonas aeruginosa]ORE37863.1 hypothetical protein BKN47_11375 [Pseudomonas aeruginosa]
MKIKIALLAIAFAALVGCSESKENQIMPKAATTDAVYSEKASKYLEDAIGTPKAKRIELTFWNESSNSDTGYLSLVVDGVEKIRPIDNFGGYRLRTASSEGFKFVYSDGTWKAYVATGETSTHGDNPQEFFSEVTGIIRRY